jgi:branched-chain amino acid transport system ATP-binding protein
MSLDLGEKIRGLKPSNITGGNPTFPLLVLFGLNAIDELDAGAFNVLLPNIRDYLGLNIQGVLTVLSVIGALVLLLEIPLAHFADRRSRTVMATVGFGAFGLFSLATGFIFNPMSLALTRAGTRLGKATSGATHRAMLTDYYPIEVRPAVFGVHSAANSIGQFIGPIVAGFVGHAFGFRWPFIIFGVPTLILVLLSARLKEPVRGAHERRAMGADEETALTEEVPASFSEAWRILWQVRTLRRIFIALPFLSIPLVALAPLIQLFYSDVMHLDEAQRGIIASVTEPFQFVGLLVGIPIATKLLRRDPALLLRFLSALGVLQILSIFLLVATRNLPIVIVMRALLAMAQSSTSPGLAAAFSLILPPRVRSLGFTISNIFVLPAILAGPIIGGFADRLGLQAALIMVLPVIGLGYYILASAGSFIGADISKVRTSALAMAEVRRARLNGQAKLLVVRDLDVSYDTVQVLFNVSFEVDEGEIVALLGTNGAGKSTLLKAISGIVEADGGAIVFDGADTTYAPPNEVVSRGIVQVPGGRGVFPTLTVAENLRISGWLYRRETAYIEEATKRVLDLFPVLKTRWDQPAGNLSGGEQQMLTLSMAFIAKPRLLMIDELSLGLAPVIVEQLLKIVQAIRDNGTTIIVVEQSVNVALTIAETAYFMEKGEIRFRGPTSELLNRPEILRSVFLEGAGVMNDASPNGSANGNGKAASAVRARGRVDPTVEGDLPVALELRNISKSYGGVRAVNDVSFDLREGKILGVIGPNGAGKTTLFDLVSGFVRPDDGSVVFHGRDITDLPPDARARIGLGRSFQDARLFPALTVRETVSLALDRTMRVKDPVAAALRLPDVGEAERNVRSKVDELIELMGLQAFANKFVAELSTGSRRIVDLACLLGHEPTVLLFDEPSSGIAQRETEALGPLLVRIRDTTGASLLVIEHDMPLITSVADEILALDLGATVTRGTATEVVNHPQVVASYLGTSEEIIARSGAVATPRRRRRRATTTERASAVATLEEGER